MSRSTISTSGAAHGRRKQLGDRLVMARPHLLDRAEVRGIARTGEVHGVHERVGHPAHRRDDDEALRLGSRRDDVGDAADSRGVGEARAAELVDDTLGTTLAVVVTQGAVRGISASRIAAL